MSTAELKISNMCKSIYSDYQIDRLTFDERMLFLSVFSQMFRGDLLSEKTTQDESNLSLPKYTKEELRARVAKADEEILSGETHPIEEFFEEVGRKYPWL